MPCLYGILFIEPYWNWHISIKIINRFRQPAIILNHLNYERRDRACLVSMLLWFSNGNGMGKWDRDSIFLKDGISVLLIEPIVSCNDRRDKACLVSMLLWFSNGIGMGKWDRDSIFSKDGISVLKIEPIVFVLWP